MSFSAHWSNILKVMSALSTAICAIAGIAVFASFPLLAGAILLLPVVAVAFCIRGYTLERERLLVHRAGWNTEISLRDLIGCEAMPLGSFRAIRTFGNGGFFSFSGWYYNRSLGHHRAYVTDHNDLVMLRFKHRVLVISPRPRDEFVRALNDLGSVQA